MKTLTLAATALTVSLASAQSVYAPTGFASTVMPAVNPDVVAAPQWSNAQANTVMPGGNMAAMPAPSAWNNSVATQAELVPGPVAPGQNPFAVRQPMIQPAPAPMPPSAPTQAAPLQVAPAPAYAGAPAQQTGVVNPFAAPAPAQTAIEVPNGRAAPFSLDLGQNGGGEAGAEKSDRVDVTALRYYASNRDLQRVGAEMRRLKTLYPGWEPPADLFAPQSSVDEQPLWDLYAAGQYPAIRAKIAAYKSVNPQWNPSEDLMSKLDTAEARLGLDRAFAAGNWNEVVAIASSRPSLMVCEQMQSLWDVGEALAHMRDFARSFDLYKYILANCANSDERLATVQKASLVLPEQGVASLVMLGRIMPDGTSEFEDVGFNPVRSRMGRIAAGEPMVPPVGDDELRRFADFVQRDRSADDAALFGWYYYSLEEWEAAQAWFAAASFVRKDPKFTEGMILSLRKLDRADEALALARKTRKMSPALGKQYIEIVSDVLTNEDSELTLSESEFDEFQTIVREAKSALGAQAIGWRYIAGKDTKTAREWFSDSLEWQENEGAVIGLAVSAARLRQYKTLASLRERYGEKYEALAKFKR